MFARLFIILSILVTSFCSVAEEGKYSETSIYDKPLMERYVLDELKALRMEQQDLEKRLVIEITDRELEVADKSLNYANVTVTYFFYIIAGAASIIAIIGWQSMRELRENAKKAADQQLKQADEKLKLITEQYEKKFQALERDLRRKTRLLSENNKEIERINEVHNLWLRAQSSQTAEQKMEVYDEILKIRPGDLEALTHKADAAMEIREFHWALSLCNRVLEVDDRNAHAWYQRACAYACLGVEEQAISDLEIAVNESASLRELAADEADFETLRGNERFESMISSQEG